MDSTCTSDAFLSQTNDGAQAKLFQDAGTLSRRVLELNKAGSDQTTPNQHLPMLEINCDGAPAKGALSGTPFVLPEVDLVGLSSMRETAQDEQARFKHELRRQRQDDVREANENRTRAFEEETATKVKSALSSFKSSLEDAATKGYTHAVVYNIPQRPILISEYESHLTRPQSTPEYRNSRKVTSEILSIDERQMERFTLAEKQLVQTLSANGWTAKLIRWSSGQQGICVELP